MINKNNELAKFFYVIFLLLTPNAYASTFTSLAVIQIIENLTPLPSLSQTKLEAVLNINSTETNSHINVPLTIWAQTHKFNSKITIQKGLASWYGSQFHGRETASGARFNMHALTAAHRTLPLGTYVKVTNLKNNKTVVVEINDRGPYARKRILDLSFAAANVLNFREQGETEVSIEGLKYPTLLHYWIKSPKIRPCLTIFPSKFYNYS